MSKAEEEFPFMTKYDPPGSSEGTLDPLGLYLIADQLAMKLVPAVRERMLRIRFLTAMTVGSLVTEGVECNPRHPETPAYLVWEWLLVEAIVRSFEDDSGIWGVPGSDVTRKAVSRYGYVDQRSYLKTPRVFGFNGVYKRLATHMGLVDTHLMFREPEGDDLVFNWSRDLGIGKFSPSHAPYDKWRKAVEASLGANPPRTKTYWKSDDWKEVAGTFTFSPKGAEKGEFHLCCSFFEDLLHFVPGDPDDPVKLRALGFIHQVRDRVDSWKDSNQDKGIVRRRFVFTMPAMAETEAISGRGAKRQSALTSCLEKCRRYGPAPAKALVASPFFDQESDNHQDEATKALCNGMGRKITRCLTLCVPAIGGEDADSLRLTAPISLFKTGRRYSDQVVVEVLPSEDTDHNQRPWHAKMLWLESQSYSALMIGSSNFTQAGLGLKDHCNVEANLLTVVDLRKSYAREPGELAECWPQTKAVPNPEEVEWTGMPYTAGEDTAPDQPLLPQGFVSAVYRAGGSKPSISLCLLSEKLPDNWRVLAGSHNDGVLLDSIGFAAKGKESPIELPWDFGYAPSKLLVSWHGKEAFWPVNVEDQGSLPVPEEMENMSANDLMAILAASDAGAVFRAWCRHRGLLEDDDQLDCALPAELDPLRRFDLQETFLHRIRKQARMMASVRINLERPAWSLRSLDWRLHGILGVERLAERMVKELEAAGGNRGEAIMPGKPSTKKRRISGNR